MFNKRTQSIMLLTLLLASFGSAAAQVRTSSGAGRRIFTPAPTAGQANMPLPESGDVIYFSRPAIGAQGQWWKDSKITQQVKVSDDQVQQMDQIFQAHRLRLIDLFANVERQETMLEPLISGDNPDDTQVETQIDKIAAARAELEKANARMLLSIRRVLTLEQWKRLQSVQPAEDMDFTIPVPPPPGTRPTVKRK